jgi:hypothetical protein
MQLLGIVMLVTLLKKVMENKSALLAGILAGLNSPTEVYADHHYSRLHGSDKERLRGDVSRIGNDFSRVIEREHGQKQEPSKYKLHK